MRQAALRTITATLVFVFSIGLYVWLSWGGLTMYAVIRIKSFYERLWGFMPLVTMRSYDRVCKIAANYHDDWQSDRFDLIAIQDVLAKERAERKNELTADFARIQHLEQLAANAEQRVKDLGEIGDSLRRRLSEEENQCARLSQLLREVQRISDSKNLQSQTVKERT